MRYSLIVLSFILSTSAMAQDSNQTPKRQQQTPQKDWTQEYQYGEAQESKAPKVALEKQKTRRLKNDHEEFDMAPKK